MMRFLLLFALLIIVYHSVKTVFRSALKTYHEGDQRSRIKGDEMVLDPSCRTYVLKDRAVTRRIRGTVHSFCSEACARRYEKENEN